MSGTTTHYDTINNNPRIKIMVNILSLSKTFYIEKPDGTHINLYGIKFDNQDRLIFLHNRQYKTVNSLIKEVKHLQTARWLNHVYFKKRDGRNQKKYKDYLTEICRMNFS